MRDGVERGPAAGVTDGEVEAGALAIIRADRFPDVVTDEWWVRALADHHEQAAEFGDMHLRARSLVTDAMRASRAVLETAASARRSAELGANAALREEVAEWMEHVREVNAYAARLQDRLAAAEVRADAAERDRDAARAVLRQVEWQGSDRRYARCPCCRQAWINVKGKVFSHALDCALAAALAAQTAGPAREGDAPTCNETLQVVDPDEPGRAREKAEWVRPCAVCMWPDNCRTHQRCRALTRPETDHG